MDKSIDHIGACELSSAVSNRDSWPLASAGGGHLNGEVEGNFTFRSLPQVCLLDGMLCTVLSHLQCAAGSGGRVTGAPNRAPLGIMWGPSWVETSHPQWGRRGSPGWGWGLPLGRETAQWRDAVTLKVTGTLETPLLLWWGDTTWKNSSSEEGHSVMLCETFKYIKNFCIFYLLVWVSWGQNVNFCRANWTCFFLCESVGDSTPKGERERVK